MSILKVLRVPLSFSLFNFQGPTHFLESFLSVLTEPLSTVRELLYHIHFRLSTLFSKFLKSFWNLFHCFSKAFFCAFPLSTVRELLYHIHFRLSTLFSKFLKSFWNLFHCFSKAFFCAFKLFCCLCFSQATLLLYHNYIESQYLFKFLLTNQFVFSTYILYKMLHLSIIFYKYDIFYLYQDNLSTKTIILILLTSL